MIDWHYELGAAMTPLLIWSISSVLAAVLSGDKPMGDVDELTVAAEMAWKKLRRYLEEKERTEGKDETWLGYSFSEGNLPEERAEMEALVGLKFLGAGKRRWVFEMGDYVLKLQPYPVSHTAPQLNEVALWRESKSLPAVREKLAPIVAYDPAGRWLVMPKAKMIGWDLHKPPWRQRYIELQETLNEPIEVDDISVDNVGIYQGRLVVIDYEEWERE